MKNKIRRFLICLTAVSMLALTGNTYAENITESALSEETENTDDSANSEPKLKESEEYAW